MIHASVQHNLFKKIWAISHSAFNLLRRRPIILNLNVNCTNACNQQCPMCNAELVSKNAKFLSIHDYKRFLHALKPYAPSTVTLSGGEPTLVPDLPEIIEYSVKYFPFGVALNSNFYSGNQRFQENMISALKANIRISCSFDAFGDEANRQRGAKLVEEKTLENLKWVAEQKKKLKSTSLLIVHTVISDITLHHVERIFELSQKYGYEQRIAPAINFFYQFKRPDTPGLSPSPELKKILDQAIYVRKLKQNPIFIKGIYAYTKKMAPKLCPYLSWPFKTHKIFLDPNGDISLCDRNPIGNLNQMTLTKMLQSSVYFEKMVSYQKCPGCWLACFVEPLLAFRKKESRLLEQFYKNG